MAKTVSANINPETYSVSAFPLQPRYVSIAKWIIGTAVFAYVLVRAFILDPTGDEVLGRLSYGELLAACNRLAEQAQLPSYLLGTLGMDILPFEPFVSSRMLNSLFTVLLLYSAGRLTRFIPFATLQILGFLVLTCNAYVLDWFSLNRGYGNAYACAMTAMCFLCELTIADRGKTIPRGKIFLAAWSAAAAAICNLALLHFYVAFSTVLLCWLVSPMKLFRARRTNASLLIELKRIVIESQYLLSASAVLFAYAAPKFFALRTNNLLYSGGTVGFVHDSVGTIVSNSLYRIKLAAFPIEVLAWFATAMAIFMGVYSLIRNDRNTSRMFSLLFFFVQMLHFAVIYTLHLTAELNFIWHRGALILVLLFSGQLCFFVASVSSKSLRATFLMISIVYVAIAFYGANFDYVLEQRMLSKQRKMLRALESIHEKTNRPILLGCSDTLKLKLNYYQKKWGFDWLNFYSIDMHVRFNRPYQIHPDTTHFYIWSPKSMFPERLRSLPIEEVPGFDYPYTESDLYQVKPGAKLQDYLRFTK